MNIRKAVELADGFALCHTAPATAVAYCYPGGTINVFSGEFPQWFKDALRCQLERQVDALDGHLFESGGVGQALVWRPDDNMRSKIEVRGPDRTDNTINAIVESGVLE